MTVDGQGYAVRSSPIDGQEHSSLTTVDVQGHAVPGLYAPPVVGLLNCSDTLSRGFTPFQSFSLMAVERQEHSSIDTTVDVQRHVVLWLYAFLVLQSQQDY